MALGTQIVDFARPRLLYQPDQVGGIGEIAIVQEETGTTLMRVDIDVVDTLGVERGRPALDAMNDIAFLQQ
jgi:hypothetical protein